MTTITRKRARAALAAILLATPAWPADLALPTGARLQAETTSDSASYRLPVGPWDAAEGIPALRVEGVKTRQAWRLDGQSVTTLQLLSPLRDQLEKAGYEVIFECSAAACGGFDFRFETEVLPGPTMYVNLSDYRFLSARRPGDGIDAVSLLVSRSAAAAFIQIIRVRDAGDTAAAAISADRTPVMSQATGDLAQRLESAGHVALLDLEFAVGSFELGDGPIGSLDQIAAYMAANPDRRVVFVGHTDATGSLDANIALSRRRASAAVRYLVDRHGIAGTRLSADGVGYLSPIATNLTEAGRALNRRIEAVVLPGN